MAKHRKNYIKVMIPMLGIVIAVMVRETQRINLNTALISASGTIYSGLCCRREWRRVHDLGSLYTLNV